MSFNNFGDFDIFVVDILTAFSKLIGENLIKDEDEDKDNGENEFDEMIEEDDEDDKTRIPYIYLCQLKY